MAPKTTVAGTVSARRHGNDVDDEESYEEDDETSNGKSSKKSRSVLNVAFRRACRDMYRFLEFGVDASMGLVHIFMKILGPCLICLALSLIGFVTFTFFWHFIPSLELNGVGLLERASLSFTGVFLLFNVLYNYGKAILLDAGTPPEFDDYIAQVQEAGGGETGRPPKPRQCARCTRVKPPRTHHCSICRRCVLKMDHHCPWVNNCVGHNNYRHFCLFMLFLALVCGFVVLCFYSLFLESFTYRRRGGQSTLNRSGRSCVVTSFMVCASIMVALSILGGFHVFLALTNQTTIEFQTNMLRRREARRNGEFFRNPYDLGRSRNFQQVFGQSRFFHFKWMLPWLFPSALGGDGMRFASLSRIG